MSVVLVTDTYEEILPVIERLRAQTARDRLEIVLVSPAGDRLRPGAGDTGLDSFARVQMVEAGFPVALGEARAAGVRAASAPLVFIGETHSYPHPRMAELLIEAHTGGWTAVVPGFGNANPDETASWAGFLLDYGAWSPGMEAGTLSHAPMYNASYRRSALLEFGDRLETALRGGDEMENGLRARNQRVYFEPSAKIDHLNVTNSAAWVRDRFLSGVLIAAARARRWSWRRRLFYVCASPLLPGLYLSKVRAGVRAWRRDQALPLGTLPLVVVGAVLKGAGEMIGYARGSGGTADEVMTDLELHRSAYASMRSR